jgi:hypothetical protein
VIGCATLEWLPITQEQAKRLGVKHLFCCDDPGHGAIIHAATVEDNVLVGMGATILDGVTVGFSATVFLQPHYRITLLFEALVRCIMCSGFTSQQVTQNLL